MKKILSVSILAVLAVAPLSAKAEGTVVAVPNASTINTAVDNTAVASTAYVKGAYDALQAPVANIRDAMNVTDLETRTDGKTHIVDTGTGVAANLKALDTAVLNLTSSSSDTYVTKTSADATAGGTRTLNYATGNGEAVGANLAALDAQVKQNTDDIGTMNTLGTATGTNLSSNKANVVTAVNKLDSDMGTVSALTTDTKNLAGAVNELDAELGTITTTAMHTSADTVSGAIAEVKDEADANAGKIGTLSLLTTTQKGNLVDAINEVKSTSSNAYQTKTDSAISAEQAAASHGYLTQGQGVGGNLVSLANGINTEKERAEGVEGTLGNLTTSSASKVNLVSAINEVNSKELEVYSGWNNGGAPTQNPTNVTLVVPTGA